MSNAPSVTTRSSRSAATAEEFLLQGGPGLGLSIVEALDTLYVMGLDAELEEGVRWIENNLHFDIDGELQVFETNIRMVGGLLSGWLATKNKRLLELAQDLADRLLPAFTKSPTGMPYRFVNLKTGAVRDPASYPAEIGTYISEFGTLSRAVGDTRYYDAAKKAAKACFDRRSSIDLVADNIDIETGKWLSRRASIGPPSDSYFEYLYGGWRLFGDADFKNWYDVHAKAIADAPDRNSRRPPVVHAGGFRNRRAAGSSSKRARGFLCRLARESGRYGARPRLSQFLGRCAGTLRRFAGGLRLRHDSRRRDQPMNCARNSSIPASHYSFIAAANIGGSSRASTIENMKATSRAAYGYTIIDDITARPMKQGDACPGYWWAEQMKYYYLLFSNTDRFNYKRNYLSTEGKILDGLK